MNLDELRSVQSKERSKDSLQHLRESFYADVATYVQELRDERERIADEVENPFDSDDISRLSDEIETAEDVVEALYERRVGKVVKRASIAAAGMPVDEDGLTTEEQELYDDLVSRIRTNKTRVLDVLGGEIPVESGTERTGTVDDEHDSADEPTTPTDSTPEVSVADAMGDAPAETGADTGENGTDGDSPPPEPPKSDVSEAGGDRDDVERRTVRITRDIGDIFGVDEREYRLEREDVVTLPAANADPLVERDAAERLD